MFAAFLSTVCGSLLSICVTALSAFSVTIIFRTSTTANFAQGSIAAFGCYVVAECLNRWGVPVYLGVLPGMIVGVVIGLFIDLMVFRKGRHVGELGKQIITMGFVSLFYGGIPLVFGKSSIPPPSFSKFSRSKRRLSFARSSAFEKFPTRAKNRYDAPFRMPSSIP